MPPPLRIEATGQTHPGKKRRRNDDSFAVLPHLGLFLVADGLGGLSNGDLASRMAVDTIRSFFEQPDPDRTWPFGVDPTRDHDEARLILAVWRANRNVYDAGQNDVSKRGMGTTLSGVLVSGERIYLAHVGDSRVYRLRDQHLTRLTDDHTALAEYMRAHGPLPPHLAGISGKNALTRALGTHKKVQVDTRVDQVMPGDLLLLCSDGLTAVVTDDEIAAALRQPVEIANTAEELIERANARGGPDNVTCVLVRWRW
jgi:protein phosphatase